MAHMTTMGLCSRSAGSGLDFSSHHSHLSNAKLYEFGAYQASVTMQCVHCLECTEQLVCLTWKSSLVKTRNFQETCPSVVNIQWSRSKTDFWITWLQGYLECSNTMRSFDTAALWIPPSYDVIFVLLLKTHNLPQYNVWSHLNLHCIL